MPDTPQKKNILLCVAGATPQIITETLYDLTITKGYRIDEVRVITTLDGRDKIMTGVIKGRGSTEESLLDRDHGQFYAFLRDYPQVGSIEFDETRIALLRTRDGKTLEDIRTPGDNELAGDQICEIVREICSDENTRLFASAAGGRKTMSIYLTTAMQLFGRADDNLSHVLVNENFETNPQFFYPPPEPQMIRLRDGRTISTEQAEIYLAEIPFIRLQGMGVKQQRETYKETVDRAQAYLDSEEKDYVLEIDPKDNLVSAGTLKTRLSDYEILLFVLFGGKKLTSAREDDGFVAFRSLAGSDLEAAFQTVMIAKEGEECPMTEERLRDTDWAFLLEIVSQAESGNEKDYHDLMNSLSRAIGRANNKLRKAGFPPKYEITAKGNSRPKRYGIDLPKELLRIREPK